MTEAATFRREPTQARAKARVERILAAASELIAETGSDAVRMSEIAERAGVPIGSLYQYFPDKAAMLRTLALRFMDRVREGLRVGLGGIETGEEALTRVDDILRGYYEVFITEPVVRDIWSGTQSDKELQALDVEDSRENGRIFFEALKLSGAAVRLAIAVDRKEGDRLMVEYRGMIRREMERFLFPA